LPLIFLLANVRGLPPEEKQHQEEYKDHGEARNFHQRRPADIEFPNSQ
jgi:hypothetical protein